jgi:hypothetical protein
MSRIAHCCCGSLQVEVTGEPMIVAACHCQECQRRTGAPYGVGAYFERTQIRAEGASKVYVRDGQEGRKLRMHFCPECGSTVYWEADRFPEHLGVAVGAFADPSFPAPTNSVWEQTRHPWVDFGQELNHFPQAITRQLRLDVAT